MLKILASAVLFFVLCMTFNAAPVDKESAAAEKIIREITRNAEKYYAEGRADLVAELYTEDACLMNSGNLPIVGRENIKHYFTNVFKNGKVSVSKIIPSPVDTLLTFYSEKAVIRLLSATPTEQIFMVLKGELSPTGNASYLNLFFFFLSLLLGISTRC